MNRLLNITNQPIKTNYDIRELCDGMVIFEKAPKNLVDLPFNRNVANRAYSQMIIKNHVGLTARSVNSPTKRTPLVSHRDLQNTELSELQRDLLTKTLKKPASLVKIV